MNPAAYGNRDRSDSGPDERPALRLGVGCQDPRDGRKRELVNYLEEHQIETRDLMPLLSQPVYLERFGDRLECQDEVGLTQASRRSRYSRTRAARSSTRALMRRSP